MQGTDNLHDLHRCSRYQYLKTEKMILVVAESHKLANEHVTCDITQNQGCQNITELKPPSLKVLMSFLSRMYEVVL